MPTPPQERDRPDTAAALDARPSRVGNVLAGARGAANDALHETQKAAQRVGKAAEANPLAAVGAGIAVGLAVGALIPKSRRETELLGATGRRLTGAASDAVEAARHAAKIELATLPLSREAARAQAGKVFDQVAKALSGAGEAALSSRSRSRSGSTPDADADAPDREDDVDEADDDGKADVEGENNVNAGSRTPRRRTAK